MATLEKAILIAVQAHHGQTDKAGDPYILHSLRVMLHMTHEKGMVAAVLHDVVEDTKWTTADLRQEGFSEEVLGLVDCLTRREQESYEKFIERVNLNPTARRIKIADLEENMDVKRIREPKEEDWERAKKYDRACLRLKDEREIIREKRTW